MILLVEPPAPYDHPFHGQVIEQRLSLLDIIQACHGPAGGCAWVSNGVCHIALPRNETDRRLIALIRQHEIAHCNGWSANHPGGHQVEYDPDPPKGFKYGHMNLSF